MNTCPYITTRRAAFTIIELLVVISVIAMLISILLPALAGARNTARAAVCGSNIRQLHLANTTYAYDNHNFYVRAARDLWYPNHERWHGTRTSMNVAFEPSLSPLADYFGSSGEVKECPAFQKGDDYISDDTQYQSDFEDGCGGYGYNATYIGARNDLYGSSMLASETSARVQDPANPAQTLMFADTAYYESSSRPFRKIAYSFIEPPFFHLNAGPDPSDMQPNPSIVFRHHGNTNAAWADGHITPRQISFTSEYLTHSDISEAEAFVLSIGWFGPEDNTLFDLR